MKNKHLPMMLLLPAVLLTACASSSQQLPPLTDSSVIVKRQINLPPLPESARASMVPLPSICSPTCSQGVAATLQTSQLQLTP